MKTIGIFSKFEMAGGSEFRCAEMANAINMFSNNKAYLLGERKIPQRIKDSLSDGVEWFENLSSDNIDKFYEVDSLLIINTDSKDFTTLDYWHGKSDRHTNFIDLTKIKQMSFLFNFLISPSRHLYELKPYINDIRIITANSKFFEEINKQDRYENIRVFPRMKMESPIDPQKLTIKKTPSDKIRLGMHSKGLGNKWNDEWNKLIEQTQEILGDAIQFNFMGMNKENRERVKDLPNVRVMKEDEMSVKEFLQNIDIFTYFPSWGREEPWGRVIGEAMASQCPIIATDRGGNKDQVIPGNNGYLIGKNNLKDYVKKIVKLVNHPGLREEMGLNSYRISKTFTPEQLCIKYLDFISN